MLKKIIWVVVVLLVLFAIAAFASSWYISDKLDTNLRASIENTAGSNVDVQFESTSVNTLTSEFTIRGLRMYDRETQTQINMSSVTYNLPFSELLNVARTTPRNAINVIENGTVNIQNMTVYSELAETTFSIRTAKVNLIGNLGDILNSVAAFQSPALNQTIVFDLQDLKITRGDVISSIRSGNVGNEIQRVNGTATFRPSTGKLTFDSFRINQRDMNTDVQGGLTFIKSENPDARESVDIDIKTVMRTRGSQIPVGSDDAGINFRRAEMHLTGLIPSEFDLDSFLVENNFELTLDAEQFQFYPTRTFRQGPGRGLTMLGASPDNLIIPEINGVYKLANNQIVFEKMHINTPLATIDLKGFIQLEKDAWAQSSWNNARLLINPSTQENRQMIMMISSMTGFSLNMENDRFVLPLYGPVMETRLTQNPS
jgi:hypothetical protein